ncbi:carbohydrate ABC transporter permease [Nesterenkonia sp. YGD6]|uniref:carbohydrate ABC transporter permease n=1 Tax=Nesterenkonia sp. YGD6 TaxID=2901231 RepID=UPI001F4CD8D8|nr:carbohydrate ABC transporter permease [Nesterenkonia sp. YGD6]MCH8563705.1 carbohydrate ABC transporter permease [Nesterenkonia sp. YGD6]
MMNSTIHKTQPQPDVLRIGAIRGRTRKPKSHREAARRKNVFMGVAAWAVGLLFATPVFWMILTSFHSEPDAATNPPSLLAPLTLDGYRNFFGLDGGASPWPPLINSATASVVSTILVILLAFPAAYALSIKPVKKPQSVLFFALTTKFLPIVASILPLYLFALYSGLIDNIGLLILLYTTMNLPIAVWMLQSFLAEVPKEMLEAAEMDGAKLHQVLIKVVAPVAMPGLAATALICFIFSWQELLLARTLTNVVAGTAPVFLTSFVTSQGLFLAQLCAAALAISLPVVIAGIAAQDKLVQGLSLGAVK